MFMTIESITDGIVTFPRWKIVCDGKEYCWTDNSDVAHNLQIAMAKMQLKHSMEGRD